MLDYNTYLRMWSQWSNNPTRRTLQQNQLSHRQNGTMSSTESNVRQDAQTASERQDFKNPFSLSDSQVASQNKFRILSAAPVSEDAASTAATEAPPAANRTVSANQDAANPKGTGVNVVVWEVGPNTGNHDENVTKILRRNADGVTLVNPNNPNGGPMEVGDVNGDGTVSDGYIRNAQGQITGYDASKDDFKDYQDLDKDGKIARWNSTAGGFQTYDTATGQFVTSGAVESEDGPNVIGQLYADEIARTSKQIKDQLLNKDVDVVNMSFGFSKTDAIKTTYASLFQEPLTDANGRYLTTGGMTRYTTKDANGNDVPANPELYQAIFGNTPPANRTEAMQKIQAYVDGQFSDPNGAVQKALKEYQDVTAQAAAQGKVLVVAAGNNQMDVTKDTSDNFVGLSEAFNLNTKDGDGFNILGMSDSVITVAASDTKQTATLTDDGIANFSGRGDGRYNPTISAPGFNVDGENLYGTSFAAPAVAATIAKMKEINPNLTFDQIKQMLQTSATEQAGDASNADDGAGYLDVNKALQKARESLPAATTPPATEAPPVTEAPPATEAPPVTEAPPASEAPPATEAPPASEAPPATDAPPVRDSVNEFVNAIRDFFEKLFGNNPGQTPPGDAGRNNPRPPVTNLIDIIEILFRIMLGMNRR